MTARAPRVYVVGQKSAGVSRPPGPFRARELLDAGAYTGPAPSAVIVYRIESGAHRQTGVLVEVAVDDYRHGRIRRHEATRTERERRLDELTHAAGVEQMPVILTHPGNDGLRSVIAGVAASEPDLRVVAQDGVVHTVWSRTDTTAVRAVLEEVGELGPLYIADGHHRMAAAQRKADRQRERQGDPGEAFTLAALFPREEMRILGYHRCLPMPPSTPIDDVVRALAAIPVTEHIEESGCPGTAPSAPGTVALRLGDRYYRLRLRPPSQAADVRAALDVVAVDEELLPAVHTLTGGFGASGAGEAAGHDEAAGMDDSGTAECWCATHETIRFMPHPPTIEQVMAVADAGLTMPPKSTWFDPKARAGLFLRELT